MGDSARSEALWGSPSGDSLINFIPSVVKAGSAASPSLLSPAAQDISSDELEKDGIYGAGLPTSTHTALPAHHIPGNIPLFSPSGPSFANQQPLEAFSEMTYPFFSALPPSTRPTIQQTPASSNMSRRNHNLRLPPFDSLGIAVPHPDDIALKSSIGTESCAKEHTPDSRCFEYPGSTQDAMGEAASGTTLDAVFGPPLFRAPVNQSFPAPSVSDLLTPPADQVDRSISQSSTAGGTPDPFEGQNNILTASQAHEEGGTNTTHAVAAASSEQKQAAGSANWIEVVATQILSTLDADSLDDPIKVLSHALPTPSIPGHSFPDLINALKSQFIPSSLAWINLLHAVPGRFNMSEFPTSPPSTPGLAVGEDDYFTTRVFESFAFLADDSEQSSSTPTRVQSAAAAPPSSIQVAIVERYIPPSSKREFATLFNPLGPSFLVDRMIELSPKGGSLVFIYPTKTGAVTFLEKYLAPVLDPLLRSMAVRYEFSSNLSQSIGEMTAVDHLFEFEFMKAQISKLCVELSGKPQTRRGRPTVRSSFTQIYSSTHKITPEANVWSQWWVKQEKRRIRDAVASHYGRTVQRRSLDGRDPPEGIPMNIVQEVLDSVASISRTYPNHNPVPLEVGVFVIKRESYE